MNKFISALVFLSISFLSSQLYAGTVDLTGDISISGFSPFTALDTDNDSSTFEVQITNLDGMFILDPAPIGSPTGTATIAGVSILPASSMLLSLFNSVLSSLPPSMIGTTFEFGSVGAGNGFGPLMSQTFNNVPLSFTFPNLSPISTSFDSITVSRENDSLGIIFDEAGTGLGTPFATLLNLADTGLIPGVPGPFNDGQILTSFDFDVTTTPVPVPAAVWLLLSGLLGLSGFLRKKS
ncbi:MAG: VPLPA-CTERM sorting domain-containing protein [Gammaproteobacteria bacterium]